MSEDLVHGARFMDSVGDGTGSIDMAVDGSITPVFYKYTVPAGYIAHMQRIIISVVSSSKSTSGGFGDQPALTNGLTFYVLDELGDILVDRATQLPIKKTTDLQAYCHDLILSAFGIGEEQITSRYTFARDGSDIRLDEGQSYAWRVNDDLTSIANMYIRVGVGLYKKG
jgi:hypothetical protein